MGSEKRFLAIDVGAESGRGIVMTLGGGQIEIEEIHRWANRPVRLAGTLYWDFPYLFAEMLQANNIHMAEFIPVRNQPSSGYQPLPNWAGRSFKSISNPPLVSKTLDSGRRWS